MAERTMTADELQAQLIQKAWEDDEFKRALVAEPRETLERALAVELPEDLEIVVVEEGPKKICLVLPARPDGPVERELSDEQLDQVAGGTMMLTAMCHGGWGGLFGGAGTTMALPGITSRCGRW